MNNKQNLEILSCAYTLSDMEIFIFPELIYSLVMANIMSPIIWEWRNNPWFVDIDSMPTLKKIRRIKQFIMDNFIFNLDLDTWGLTTKEKEIARFESFIDMEVLKQSNALFGYEGDKYYFDIDIRRHFGLDKYTTNIIPYWKTETIDAMHAFQLKPNYNTGAGECVSLSSLYLAALFIIGKIPLDDLYIIGTPLHSQNFILYENGILTNNRRIITKSMWFNGTEISLKARRALENEKISYISHHSGHIHTMYEKASIDPERYKQFQKKLNTFLKSHISGDLFINFLRQYSQYQHFFQIKHTSHGKNMYIECEKAFRYEHSCSSQLSDPSRKNLLNEIDEEEFHLSSIPNRDILNEVELFLNKNGLEIENEQNMLDKQLLTDLLNFLHVKPKLPSHNKIFIKEDSHVPININDSRSDILKKVKESYCKNKNSLLALHCYRELSLLDWEPFIKSAIERNPVSIEAVKNMPDIDMINYIKSIPNNSIYSESRIAQPDEVWNYQTGDGIEKAFLCANILKSRYANKKIKITIKDKHVEMMFEKDKIGFESAKQLSKSINSTFLCFL